MSLISERATMSENSQPKELSCSEGNVPPEQLAPLAGAEEPRVVSVGDVEQERLEKTLWCSLFLFVLQQKMESERKLRENYYIMSLVTNCLTMTRDELRYLSQRFNYLHHQTFHYEDALRNSRRLCSSLVAALREAHEQLRQ
uniref:GOLGA2L5 domain-containing protein n=1 Tax=Steinernema glaseri TaxID=37863 RepID=A0A1I7ZI75_9BILA